jgi:pimeloyl-ACP methyl ester carboxylesterase
MIGTRRVALPTGVTLDVAVGGREGADPILFLHGFPENHRTWRHQLADFSGDHYVVAPDQRGFGGSDKPRGARHYETGKIVEDAIALADALGVERFTLAGHDWGGAVAWSAAISCPSRIERLVIVNAPHPLVFQRSLIEDEAQRAASQYIRAFRNPLIVAGIKAMGFEAFFEKTFGAHADLSKVPPEEKERLIAEWKQPGAMRAMLNWYKAAKVKVPKEGEKARMPLWARAPFPKVKVPTLVVWGMKDKALLPVQLEGLDALVEDLRIARVQDAGHFVTWERPDAVTGAIRDFIAGTRVERP